MFFNPMASQSEQLTVNYPIEKVYRAVIAAATDGKYKVKDCNEKLFRISIQTCASAFSGGEVLTVQLTGNGDNTNISINLQ